jgi:hypothetical protein
MENTKSSFIVILQMRTVDAEEMMRIRGVLRAVTGKEPIAISDKSTTVMYFVNAKYKELAEQLDLVRSNTTSVFIAQLSEPCTTIGFSVLRSHLQEAGLLSRKK